jgi:hypothetical protein
MRNIRHYTRVLRQQLEEYEVGVRCLKGREHGSRGTSTVGRCYQAAQ